MSDNQPEEQELAAALPEVATTHIRVYCTAALKQEMSRICQINMTDYTMIVLLSLRLYLEYLENKAAFPESELDYDEAYDDVLEAAEDEDFDIEW